METRPVQRYSLPRIGDVQGLVVRFDRPSTRYGGVEEPDPVGHEPPESLRRPTPPGVAPTPTTPFHRRVGGVPDGSSSRGPCRGWCTSVSTPGRRSGGVVPEAFGTREDGRDATIHTRVRVWTRLPLLGVRGVSRVPGPGRPEGRRSRGVGTGGIGVLCRGPSDQGSGIVGLGAPGVSRIVPGAAGDRRTLGNSH